MKKLKSKKISSKTRNIIICLALILLIGTIGISYAYYANQTKIENSFKTSDYNVSVAEEFYNTWGTKKISVINNEESTPVLLRVNYDELWSKTLEDGTVLTLSNVVETESGYVNVVIKTYPSDYSTNFVDGGDGWYYYTKVLEPNESVGLLESIALNEGALTDSPYYNNYVPNTTESYDYHLNYNYEAIQASKDAAKSIWGLNVTISESGDVTWPF